MITKQSRSRQTLLTILLMLLGITAVFFGYQAYKDSTQLRGCTMEAKMCPDGSSVGRTGPMCEFTPCPATTMTPTPDTTLNWKSYTDSTYGFSFKYPAIEGFEGVVCPYIYDKPIKTSHEYVIYSTTPLPDSKKPSNGCDHAMNSTLWTLIARVQENSGITSCSSHGSWENLNSNIRVGKYDARRCDIINSESNHKEIHISIPLNTTKYLNIFVQNENAIRSDDEKNHKFFSTFDQILSTFKFYPDITDPQLQTLLTQLEQLIAKQDFNQIANLVKMTETTCDSQAPYYNPTFCDGVADGTKKSGYSVGLYQSEGTVQDKNTFIEGLQTFFTSKSNPTYLGAIITSESSSPSGLVWKNASDNNFLSFFVSKTDNSWGITGVLLGVATPEILNLEKFW